MFKVFLIYGWDGHPNEGWFPWLKIKLEENNFKVIVPELPCAEEPRINRWVPYLINKIGQPCDNYIFVGHSMGCQAIIRYLTMSEGKKAIGGAVFVAGFFKRLTNLENEETVNSVAKEWLETPVDFKKAKNRLNNCIAIFSDNDPYVPLDNKEDFEKKLGAKIIIAPSMGHFSGQAGTISLPIALSAILELSGKI